jgi:predicted transcriptional regulator
LILSTLFFWKTSIAQSDTTNISNAVSVDTVIVQVEQIQSDLDEIKEMCEKQRKLLEKKLKKKNKPDDK